MKLKRVVIVGAGLFGLTIAERCSSHGIPVTIFEKREHIGGNAYTFFDQETGINIHKYGSHIFHTNSEKVWSYVNLFSEFNKYEHKVFSLFQDKYYSMPINLLTICNFFGVKLTPSEAKQLINSKTAIHDEIGVTKSLYDKGIQTLGRELFEAFFGNYTAKQWETPSNQLPASIINRIPLRFNFDARYFTDKYQGIPVNGYTPLCEKMIASDLITVHYGIDFFEIKNDFSDNELIVYSGPIDRFFEYSLGRLNWRTIDLEMETLDVEDFQGNSVINFPELQYKFTRIHEFKHLHPERMENQDKTVIAREFSRFATEADEPYYPVNTENDRKCFEGYRRMAELEFPNIIFGGRLGSYKYLDMHMAIASALTLFENKIKPFVI